VIGKVLSDERTDIIAYRDPVSQENLPREVNIKMLSLRVVASG
jgi:hypothetical protein